MKNAFKISPRRVRGFWPLFPPFTLKLPACASRCPNLMADFRSAALLQPEGVKCLRNVQSDRVRETQIPIGVEGISRQNRPLNQRQHEVCRTDNQTRLAWNVVG